MSQLEDHLPRFLKVFAALSITLLGALVGNARPLSAAEQNPVTAIDILLEPDETMIKKAVAANRRLLEVFPKGFALGKTHAPHISTLQRYVKTADLGKVYEAVGKVWRGEARRLDVEGVQVTISATSGRLGRSSGAGS